MAQYRRPGSGGEGEAARQDPRVTFLLREGEELIQCPYDKSHFVLPKKVVLHLTRCRHNYLNANKGKKLGIGICRHSFQHHMPVEELAAHEASCPLNAELLEDATATKTQYDKRLDFLGVDQDENKRKEMQKKKDLDEQRRMSQTNSDLPRASSWEPSESGPGPNMIDRFARYDPRQHVKHNQHDLVLNPQGLTKSERAKYREKVNSGNFCEDDEELPEIRPQFQPAARDTRVPIGAPGWDLHHGYRSNSDQQRRAGP